MNLPCTERAANGHSRFARSAAAEDENLFVFKLKAVFQKQGPQAVKIGVITVKHTVFVNNGIDRTYLLCGAVNEAEILYHRFLIRNCDVDGGKLLPFHKRVKLLFRQLFKLIFIRCKRLMNCFRIAVGKLFAQKSVFHSSNSVQIGTEPSAQKVKQRNGGHCRDNNRGFVDNSRVMPALYEKFGLFVLFKIYCFLCFIY